MCPVISPVISPVITAVSNATILVPIRIIRTYLLRLITIDTPVVFDRTSSNVSPDRLDCNIVPRPLRRIITHQRLHRVHFIPAIPVGGGLEDAASRAVPRDGHVQTVHVLLHGGVGCVLECVGDARVRSCQQMSWWFARSNACFASF